MDISNLSLQDAQQYDLFQPGSLWIRKKSIINKSSIGEIITITLIDQISNIFINYNGRRSQKLSKFNNNFIPYFGDKKVTEIDIEYLQQQGN